MLQILLSLSLLLDCALCVGELQAPLTSVQQVVALTNAEAAHGLPVRLEATVTYLRPVEKNLFVMEGGYGVYIRFAKDIGLLPGDRISVTGWTEDSFRPIVVAKDVSFLSHGALPPPQVAKFEDLIQSKWDSQYVQLTGHVMAASMDLPSAARGLRIRMKVLQGEVQGIVANPGNLRPEDLIDADIHVRGVAGGAFDSKMQMAGVWLDVYSAADVELLHRPVVDPWSTPLIPMDGAVYAYRSNNDTKRVHILGTLTYYEPGLLAVIEHGGISMLVETGTTLPLHVGTTVEAMGFPEVSERTVRLGNAQLRATTQRGDVQPQILSWDHALAGEYAYNLVSTEGEVVAMVRDSRVDLLVLIAQGHLFSAALRHSSSEAAPDDAPRQEIHVGSRVRVTGVCFVEAGNYWSDQLWFDMRLRSLGDIELLRAPSWWTLRRQAYVITLLALAILGAVGWVWMLNRRVRQQTELIELKSQEEFARERRLAYQEQQRSRILELISSTEPLALVLDEVTAMVSSRLKGAACWIELKGAVSDFSDFDRPIGPGLLFKRLVAPSGISPAVMLVTETPSSEGETESSAALLAGARLAELAIDTRRLYSDLRHRSEHDLLTDVPNRFSIEKQLDDLLSGDIQDAQSFGLIYVDLDRFKEVNDRYGHRAGDLYLQAVTGRMKFQLRSGDILARIGGDEFIVLVPIRRGRADAEEIAQRLEHCFDETFEIEGHLLEGSASLGLAVYPEDGRNKEALQRSADAAMYVHKQNKREQEKRNEDALISFKAVI